MAHNIINRIKHDGTVILLALIICLVFSIPVCASDDVELSGEIIRIILPLTAAGMTAYNKDQDGFIQFSKSFLTAHGVVYALKYSIDTNRPDGGAHSSPSGHAATAFSGASFIQRRYGWKYGAPAYVAASYVGWSRVESDNHYLKDVIAGAALGIISTYIFTHPYNQKITAIPFAGKGYCGILLGSAF
jgi:membrane-associated phospholipid phosphatase